MALKMSSVSNKVDRKGERDSKGSTCKTYCTADSKSNHEDAKSYEAKMSEYVCKCCGVVSCEKGEPSKDEEEAHCYQVRTSDYVCKCCGEASCDNKIEKEFEYVKCKMFREMKPKQRLNKLIKDKRCFQCLHANHGFKKPCSNKEFGCPNEDHKKYSKTFHVIVCEEHQDEEANKKLLDEYKLKIFKKKASIPQNFVTAPTAYQNGVPRKQDVYHDKDDKPEAEHAVYMLQRIRVEKEEYNMLYDSGCGDMVCSYSAVTRLQGAHGDRAVELIPGPTKLTGVNDSLIESQHGLWMVKLPMANARNAVLGGLCLDRITLTIPIYDFDDAAKDIWYYCQRNNIDTEHMPMFPTRAGGDTDIMIGIQNKRYFPRDLVELPNIL